MDPWKNQQIHLGKHTRELTYPTCGTRKRCLAKGKSVTRFPWTLWTYKCCFPCKVRWHDFRIDPYEPSRVWFTARAMGTCLGFCYFLLQKHREGCCFCLVVMHWCIPRPSKRFLKGCNFQWCWIYKKFSHHKIWMPIYSNRPMWADHSDLFPTVGHP